MDLLLVTLWGVPTELRNDIKYDYEKLDAINECIINKSRTR